MYKLDETKIFGATVQELLYLGYTFNEFELGPVIQEHYLIKNMNKGTKVSNFGNVENKYQLSSSFAYLDSLLGPLIETYLNQSSLMQNYSILSKNVPFKLHSAEMNMQYKNDFIHTHIRNGLFSFVLWLDVPFSKETQKNNSGKLTLHSSDIFGSNATSHIELDESLKYNVIMYPSRFGMSITPFIGTDEPCVFVTGNFNLHIDD
jgi:hypothetical protein